MDPHDPTRPLQPLPPEPPRGDLPADERAWRAHVLDRLDSLRTGLVVLGVIALAALGVAVYALLTATEDDEAGGDGPSAARVSGIEDRIDELESRVEDRATKRDVSDLEDQRRELADRVEALEEQAQEGDEAADTEALRDAVETLQQDVEDLDARVQELEAQSQSQP